MMKEVMSKMSSVADQIENGVLDKMEIQQVEIPCYICPDIPILDFSKYLPKLGYIEDAPESPETSLADFPGGGCSED